MDLRERWSSRKFASAMVWQVIFTLLLVYDKVHPDLYYSLTLVTLGGYFLSNVVEKFRRDNAQA